MKIDKKVLMDLVENNSSKDEIIFHLMMNEKVPHSQIQKVLNENNIIFKKYGNWNRIQDYFRDNEIHSYEGMKKDLINFGLSDSQSKKYCSSYWNILHSIYEIGLNKEIPESEES